MADVSLFVVSPQTRSERRVSPAWTISHLRTRLEPITGIPGGSQTLTLQTSAGPVVLEGEEAQLAQWPLESGMELTVGDSRPVGAIPNFTDASEVEKYVMPSSQYEGLSESLLAFKRANKLGRFNPEAAKDPTAKFAEYAARNGIETGKRCRVDAEVKRGTVRYVGPIAEIVAKAGPSGDGFWVGVELDEPTGKNDGSIDGHRYFQAAEKCGMFVRPERVEVGDYPPLGLDDDLEEL